MLRELVKTDDGLLIFNITRLKELFFIVEDSIMVVRLLEELGLTKLTDILLIKEFTNVTLH